MTAGGGIAGMILAAGFGTRMRPVTDEIPKALLPVLGRPLLSVIAETLRAAGARTLHLNAHHLAGRLIAWVGESGIDAVVHREETILGTGGGIGNMAAALGGFETVLLHNCDVIASFGFEAALQRHRETGALATLVCLPPGPGAPPPAVRTDDAGRVTAIGGGGDLGYTGLAVFAGAALRRFPAGRPGDFVQTIGELAAERPGLVVVCDASAGEEARWADAGSPAAYLDLHRRLLAGGERFSSALPTPDSPLHAAPDALIGEGFSWEGFAEIGPGAVVGAGARLAGSVVFPGAVVEPGADLRQAIVWPGGVLRAPAGTEGAS